MKVLVTGTTGYIGKRLIPFLLELDYELVCCVRDLSRIPDQFKNHPAISFIEIDFLVYDDSVNIPQDINVAYYLMHSMSASEDFEKLELTCAANFKKYISATQVQQVIYLSGIVNEDLLSKHLQSRKQVEETLEAGQYALTTLRAGIIVGSGSASFEIIRDLVEKLPIMITPRWLNTKSQPIAIRDVLAYLSKAAGRKELYNKNYDIYGPDILTYKQMLLIFASVRRLKRFICTLPIMTPRLSSYWLYFVTSTSYKLAVSLVDSMKIEIVGRPNDLPELLDVKPISYREAVEKAFTKIEDDSITSSWKDAMVSSHFKGKLSNYVSIPEYGCLEDVKHRIIDDDEAVLNRIWALGGNTGWYYGNFLWRIRGFLDKMFGGTGIRRGRTHLSKIQAGDALDFWRVLLADREQKRLLLYAEMKLPGEAWLEFKIEDGRLQQRAVFRPKGLWGRLYWYSVLPFHYFVFNGLIDNLAGNPNKGLRGD
ncbi:SDR family oxidoreductase [Flavobacterium salilacus subsp. salilacus]|uniref:SDR family oxidoreductase n=1 Tax=Flavobacterium TaxID=237 RepID=UPI001074A34A|nr:MULTISPECIES: SDR family oxidoreductase [Flavobacterium]KAF2518114.1 SDR family oxidoreductase [Flavobacterium salilacus subsp. salilacus]MBE1615576.1 SDR family oxidoreductase [Flavobacterium sp. SaA2.13]